MGSLVAVKGVNVDVKGEGNLSVWGSRWDFSCSAHQNGERYSEWLGLGGCQNQEPGVESISPRGA